MNKQVLSALSVLSLTLTVLTVNARSPQNEMTDLETANRRITEFLDSTEVARIQTFCVAGQDDCRTLVQRKDKKTGKLSPSFYDIFSTRGRQTFSLCFLMLNDQTKRYEVYSDLTPDGKIKIDQILEQNRGVEVSFDRKKYPHVENIVLSQLGSDAGLIGVMSFSRKGSYIEGHKIKLANPELRGDKVRIDYGPVPGEL